MVIKNNVIRCVGHVAYMGDMTIAHRILVGNYEGKRPLGRCKH
jgi:hypothetical protein